MQPSHHPTLQAIFERLTQHKTNLNMQIKNYPPPIPACDTQFNYLIEKRSIIYRELSQLKSLMNLSDADELNQDGMMNFIDSSQFIDDNWLEEFLQKVLCDKGREFK